MKILISTESYYPNISGVAVFSHNLAKKMVKRGHEVFVIAPSPKFSPYSERVDGVKIFRLASRKNKFRHGYYISKNPYHFVKRIINKTKPDIVHLQDPAMISLAALKVARKNKIPVVVTNHFSLEYVVSYLPKLKIFHPLITLAMKIYLNWFYNQCQVLTCPSKTIARQFKGPITKVRLEVISNGVDLSRFMSYYGDREITCRRYKIPTNKKIILYVGRLDLDKKIDLIIAAAPKINLKEAHFVIVGEGKEAKKLKEKVQKLHLVDYFTFIDFIPYADRMLPRIYQTASVFVNPCPMETQSIVTLEAQATGLPLIVANAGALPELVEDGQNGFTFKPGDFEDLASKINLILQDPKAVKKMGEKSLEMVGKHLVEDTYNRFEKIYQSLSS